MAITRQINFRTLQGNQVLQPFAPYEYMVKHVNKFSLVIEGSGKIVLFLFLMFVDFIYFKYLYYNMISLIIAMN